MQKRRDWGRGWLGCERGLALPMALLVLASTAAMVVTVTEFSSSSGRTAQVAKARVSAATLAEAGIAAALAVLNNAVDPKTASLLPNNPPTVLNLEGGTATYWGVYNATTYSWTITSIGSIPNPTGGVAVTKQITRSAQVHGLNAGATVGAWSRMYHDNTTTCMTVTDVTIPTPISSRGDLCLVGTAKITGSTTEVDVGDDVRMTSNTTSQVDRSAGGGAGWTSSGNIVSSNNLRASASVPANGVSANLDATSFGFSIPANATITGIRVEIEKSASADTGVDDDDVYLLKAGAPSGNDKASGTDWDTSDWVGQYGSSTDLWGTTWTPAQVNASNFGVRLRADSDTSSSRTGYVDHVAVRVYYTLPPATSIGIESPLANVSKVAVGGGCTYGSNPEHAPCSAIDKVFATTITNSPQGLTKPQIDMAYWYDNAKPGPKFPCNNPGGSFPGGFDNNSTYDNSINDAAEVTPTGSSYTCRRLDAFGNIEGEISWNHTTQVLTIKGTIFRDGDFRFDDNGQIVHYQGRGIIYAAGDIEFDELVCAGGTGNESCVTQAGGMSNWNPSQNMLTVLAGDDSEFDQGSVFDQNPATPSGLQGIIYARDDCTVHENFHLSGPIICDAISLPSAPNGWPTYYTWPPLGSLTEGQAYGSPNNAADYLVTAGDQLG
jgi:hypothetical protein